MATPRYLTPRSSSYTYGPKIARVSSILGRPFMRWQHEAAGLIGECDFDGRLLHPLVVITVQRQAGKTALMSSVMLHRCTMRTQARVWYTAQTGIKAREQMWEMMDAIDLSPFGAVTKSKRGAGDTSIELPRLASRIRAHPPTPDSLHGNQSDLNVIDEGWFFDEDLAAGLMGAITPTQATRPNAQTIIISTAGTASSTWFHDLVERGRDGEFPLIDYGVGPDVEADDFEAIAAAHPAIGETQDPAILPAARAQLSAGEFIRAYGNRRTMAYERLIPAEVLELATTRETLPAGEPVFGAAVSFDRDDAVIVACVADPAGVPVLEVVDQYDTTDPLPTRLAELTNRHGGHVAIAAAGPAAATAEAAERAGATVTLINDADLSASTTDLLDRIRRPGLDPEASPGVRLRAHPSFAAAFDVVALRTAGDRVHWSRRGSAGSIAAIEAATLAVRALYTRPNPPVPPMIWSA
ncbi:terminase large subunit [Gordonia phage Rahul]|nr:terminase large subunit [Gordonia phage Rahul]